MKRLTRNLQFVLNSQLKMLASNFLVLLATISVASSSRVHCSKQFVQQRLSHRSLLDQYGAIYIATSYAIDSQSAKLVSKSIDMSETHHRLPIIFTQSPSGVIRLSISTEKGSLFEDTITSELRLRKTFSSNSECISDNEKLPLRVFSVKNIFDNASLIIFNTCRMQLDFQSEIRTEKELLLLVQGEMEVKKDEIMQQLDNMENWTKKIFDYDEFEQTDFCTYLFGCDELH